MYHTIELTSTSDGKATSQKTSKVVNLGSTDKKKWERMCVGAVVGVVVILALVSIPVAKKGKQVVHMFASSQSHTAPDELMGPEFLEGDLKNVSVVEVERAYGRKVAMAYAKKYGLPMTKARAKKDALIADAGSLWSGGVFYYTYSAGLDQTAKANFISAMQAVKGAVPRVTFVERTAQPLYTTILTPAKGCYSTSVGRDNRPQSVGLTSACSVGNSIHEIMHAMGFWHEQSRPDRDNWVTIHGANIEAGYANNFAARTAFETNDRGSPYDYGSLMHYPSWAFSWNGRDTITKNVNKGATMGQRVGMSWEDKFQMNAVYPNCDMRADLARGKSAFQSSTSSGGLASRGVDGNLNTNYRDGSCTHTSNSQYEWWAVDLGASMDVCSVSLTNRADCCGDRLKNYDIFVTNTRPSSLSFRPTSGELCVRAKNTFTGTKTLSCEGVKRGRYLGVQLRGATNPLTLCEVQVYGPPPTCSTSTIARGKSAFQSSTSSNGAASRAVDGNTNSNYHSGSCSHTSNTAYSWWAVDLGSATDVCGVVITNRADCCSERLTHFDVFVTDRRPNGSGFRATDAELCRRMPATFTFTGTRTFDCIGAMKGRYVGVQIREAQVLTLCELEVRTSN